MCLYPKLIKNRKYVANKKNKGIIPKVKDKRVLYVPVACGKCMECKKAKAKEWQVRLSEEIKHDKTGKFVTLTFSEESLKELGKEIKILDGYEKDNEIATLATRRFLERWRKKYKKSVKHWLITELGQTNTERIHLHGILFTGNKEDISKIWKYGHINIGTEKWNDGKLIQEGKNYVSEKTVNYMVKYVNKTDKMHKEYNSKILTSPGIGKGYLKRDDAKKNKYKKQETNEEYRTRTGTKLGLPIYYRNKIYTEEEKELLWLEKLDEEIRWVDGNKIDVSENLDGYYNALEAARKKNKILGYGDDSINWERKRYERERRKMLNKKKRFGKE